MVQGSFFNLLNLVEFVLLISSQELRSTCSKLIAIGFSNLCAGVISCLGTQDSGKVAAARDWHDKFNSIGHLISLSNQFFKIL